MDPLSTTIVGSRHPITFSVAKRPPLSANVDPKDTIVDAILKRDRLYSSAPHICRKPARTYKSPAAHELLSLRIEDHAIGRSKAIVQHPLNRTASEQTGLTPTAPEFTHLSPPLPLYHPLGNLALSVPVLDPTLFGHPNAVNVDDYTQLDADAIRRSSSRARRPAAKLRDRDADDEMSAILDGSSIVNGQTAGTRAASPRKRRAGGGAGSRRRRREPNGDGTYPNPPKRTRNARGTSTVATFASPLAGPAITTAEGDVPEDAEHGEIDRASAVPDVDDTHIPTPTAEDLELQEQRRSTRSRRPRPPAPKRGLSSASETTTTSVSVSIAANPRNTRSSGVKPYQELAAQDTAAGDVDMKQEGSVEEPHDQVDSTEQASILLEADRTQPLPAVPQGSGVPMEASDKNESPHEQTEDANGKNAASAEENETPRNEQLMEVDLPAHNDLQKQTDTPDKTVHGTPSQDERPANEISEPQGHQAALLEEKAKEKDSVTQDKPKIGQKISPLSWTRFATPVAGLTGPTANQKKIRDEEKEEGELSEESDGGRPRR